MVISTFVLFLRQLFIMHLCFYICNVLRSSACLTWKCAIVVVVVVVVVVLVVVVGPDAFPAVHSVHTSDKTLNINK